MAVRWIPTQMRCKQLRLACFRYIKSFCWTTRVGYENTGGQTLRRRLANGGKGCKRDRAKSANPTLQPTRRAARLSATLDGAMTQWLSEYWHVVYSLCAGALIIAFYVYARLHPGGLASALWQRSLYTAMSLGVCIAILTLLTALLFPTAIALLFSPYSIASLFVLLWFDAPYLRRIFPLQRAQS